MIINLIRLDSLPEKIIHEGSLIDFIYDEGLLDTTHTIFKASLDKCSSSNEVEKTNKAEFMSKDGEFTIVETPGGLVVFIIAIIAIAVAAYVYMQSILPDQDNIQQGANNSLTNRQNRERPLERIEDIAGEVRSYPTLIQQVYKKFTDDNEEVEYSLMCISIGEGEILSSTVKDGETPLRAVSGSGAMFYPPNSLASVGTPFLTVGETFNEKVKIIKRSNEVAGGQTLDWGSAIILNVPAGQATAHVATGTEQGVIDLDPLSTQTFERLEVGEIINLVFVYNSGSALELDGRYEVMSKSVDNKQITLDAEFGFGVNEENPDWALIPTTATNEIQAEFDPINSEDRIYQGPYFLSSEDRTEFFVNIVAGGGLQNDDGDSITVEYGVEYAQADEDGNRIDDWSSIITSSMTNNNRDRMGDTINVVTSFTGPCLVRVKRITGKIKDAQTQDVTLDALYSVEPLGVESFGDVTTVQVRVLANAKSSQVKQRKFNCIFKRKLQKLNEDGTLGAFEPTRRFIDYFMYASLDSTIGRRDASEVNSVEIYEKYQELTEYFGSEEAGLFDYTFDNDQLSFQQILSHMTNACFCNAVRKAGIITLRLDMPQTARTLFTHRSKIPNSQTITRTFESEGQKDGIEFQYIDPDNNSTATITIPTDSTPLRPEKFSSIGVRNHNQAWWLACRRYNLLRNRRVNLSDTFTADGSLLSTGDVVAITNNTKGNPESGDVLQVSGFLLKLSENVEFADSVTPYSIALKMRDGTVDVIPCDAGPMTDEVVLSRMPRDSLYTGYEEERTTFIFSEDETLSAESYIIKEVNRQNTFEIPITAFNYSEKYYQNDGETSPNN